MTDREFPSKIAAQQQTMQRRMLEIGQQKRSINSGRLVGYNVKSNYFTVSAGNGFNQAVGISNSIPIRAGTVSLSEDGQTTDWRPQ